uniref:Mucin 13, cell surface associated n=1 Tax=Acanthochromis polyacanthus TaxID=80966 RepID=A0A3Q1GZ97_9TELE
MNSTSTTPTSAATPLSSTANTNTTLTAGPSTSTPASTSNSLPPSTSPGSSTAPPTGNTSTLNPSAATPGATTTTPISNTITPTFSTTTVPPTEVTTSNTTTTAPPPPIIVCPAVPCPPESVCLNGTCQCLSGSFLLNGRCTPAQVFPGQLHIVTLTFQDEMRNRSSSIFQTTAAEISAALEGALRNQPGYVRSDVVQLEPGSVQAIVNNVFQQTNATQESVDQVISQAAASSEGLLANATFTSTNLCNQEPLPCDVSTTLCTNTNGRAVCSCRDGYISIVYSNTSCRACPSGERAVGGVCQPCAFGYAGFNCNDSSLLAVVVISCVLGGILLILILALLIFCCWTRCSLNKTDFSSPSPYSSGEGNQPWPTGITPIPRATTQWDGAPSIEMTEGGSTHNLVDKKHQSNGLGFQLKPKGWKKVRPGFAFRSSFAVMHPC